MKNRLFDFSNKKRLFRVVLAHLTAMLAVMVIIWFIIDRVNSAMEFMTSELSKWYIAVLAVFSLILSVTTIVSLWVRPRAGRTHSIEEEHVEKKNDHAAEHDRQTEKKQDDGGPVVIRPVKKDEKKPWPFEKQ